jgi:hypothetical protein
MFTKTTFALAFALATTSGALATTKSQSIVPSQNVYNPAGAYVGTDPHAKSSCGRTRTGRADSQYLDHAEAGLRAGPHPTAQARHLIRF